MLQTPLPGLAQGAAACAPRSNANGTEPAGNNLELIVLARLAPEIDLREHEYEPSEFCLALGVQAAQFLPADGIGFRRTQVFLR